MFLNKRLQNQAEKMTQKVGFSPIIPKQKYSKWKRIKLKKILGSVQSTTSN